MEALAVGLFCLAPVALFGAGWAACYVLMVKYQMRFERRQDYDQPQKSKKAGKDPVWTP